MEVADLRETLITAHGLTNVDRAYTFYYDETNNVRRLHLTPDGFNIRSPQCFVLGGIVHRGAPRPLDIAQLRNRLSLQKTVREMKLTHLGKGDFLSLLGSHRIGAFLDWLRAEGLLVHYQVIDLLYWSIVDIVDSIVSAGEATHLMMVAPMLKDSLYSVLRADVDGTASLLHRYDYPNVGRENRQAFIGELLELAEQREEMLDHFSYYMLKGLLQIGANLDSLPYLEDETPNVVIDGFGPFFLHRISTFINASHILDNEDQIRRYLVERQLTYRGEPLRHYRFADSLAEPGVQLSDVVSGFLGKLFSYVNRNPLETIETDVRNLDIVQSRNLARIAGLLDLSTDECPAFANYLLSLVDQERAGFLLNPRVRTAGAAA